MTDEHNCQKVKTLIDFDKDNYNSIESLVAKKSTNVKITSAVINGKMLTFSKISRVFCI